MSQFTLRSIHAMLNLLRTQPSQESAKTTQTLEGDADSQKPFISQPLPDDESQTAKIFFKHTCAMFYREEDSKDMVNPFLIKSTTAPCTLSQPLPPTRKLLKITGPKEEPEVEEGKEGAEPQKPIFEIQISQTKRLSSQKINPFSVLIEYQDIANPESSFAMMLEKDELINPDHATKKIKRGKNDKNSRIRYESERITQQFQFYEKESTIMNLPVAFKDKLKTLKVDDDCDTDEAEANVAVNCCLLALKCGFEAEIEEQKRTSTHVARNKSVGAPAGSQREHSIDEIEPTENIVKKSRGKRSGHSQAPTSSRKNRLIASPNIFHKNFS